MDEPTCKNIVSVPRRSNFELLRIIAMVFICLYHYTVDLFKYTVHSGDFVYKITAGTYIPFGEVGVVLFVLITGYFMIDKKFNIKRFLKIILDTFFYSYSILIIVLVFTHIPVTKIQIYRSLFPMAEGIYWFITTYLMLYILIPVLNKIFNSLNKKQIEFYLLIFLTLQSLIPTFTYKIHFAGSSLSLMIIMYFIGAYIKRYGLPFFERKRNCILTITFSACFVYG